MLNAELLCADSLDDVWKAMLGTLVETDEDDEDTELSELLTGLVETISFLSVTPEPAFGVCFEHPTRRRRVQPTIMGRDFRIRGVFYHFFLCLASAFRNAQQRA